tara:strand:+ start:469 stop:870 length:402 start_codon:yes stop_codon:yes gene_type:complete
VDKIVRTIETKSGPINIRKDKDGNEYGWVPENELEIVELFELRIYPKPSDAYEKDGKYYLIGRSMTLEEANKRIEEWGNNIRKFSNDPAIQEYIVDLLNNAGEIVAVSHTDGKRYFAPRDGFGWMDVTKTEEI